MKRTGPRNLFFITAVVVAAAVAIFAFNFPSPVKAVAGLIVTSISIFFGMSLALISFASAPVQVSEISVPKKQDRTEIETDILWENGRTLFRQKLAVSVFVVTVILGILFIGADDFAPSSTGLSLASAAFGFASTLSFAISIVLPFSISRVVDRHHYFRR